MFTPDVAAVVGFLKSVFDADAEMPAGAPALVRIGDSVIMVSDGGGAREFLPTFLYVYVEDTDRVCQRAVEAGARIIEHPADMPYGDRRATVRDPWGNTWQIAQLGRRASRHRAYRRAPRTESPNIRVAPPSASAPDEATSCRSKLVQPYSAA
jgi:PhnB protein